MSIWTTFIVTATFNDSVVELCRQALKGLQVDEYVVSLVEVCNDTQSVEVRACIDSNDGIVLLQHTRSVLKKKCRDFSIRVTRLEIY